MSLAEKRCLPCEKGTPPLSPEQAKRLLGQAPGWEMDSGAKMISRHFSFESYWEGLGFVNAVAWIAQKEQHHPDVELLYKKVTLRYSTHAINGLSENDFICAAKVNALQG
jgi:4a-hydroxytetrahydrobiopterin dehydratase